MNTQDEQYLIKESKIIHKSDFSLKRIELSLREAYVMGRRQKEIELLQDHKSSINLVTGE